MKRQYDYIICGAGAAGLSLAYRLASEEFQHLSILLIDKELKNKNDRTWCFWTEGDGLFDQLAEKSWNKVLFRNDKMEKLLDIEPFEYIKIRGIDFYDHTLNKIKAAPNITFLQAELKDIETREKNTIVRTKEAGDFEAQWAFSSILKIDIDKKKYNYVDQHFKGWFIKTKEEKFNPDVATFMDFDIPQLGECRFMYVLPTSKHEALVELAIFSNNILAEEEYHLVIKKYITEKLRISTYEIEEEEIGVIPMTTFPFEQANKNGLTYIGTAGSAAKASTGFAFLHIQDQADHLIEKIKSNSDPTFAKGFFDNKYRWYDKILLNVLLNQRAELKDVFGEMFEKLPASLMLKFLSNKTSFYEDLKILSKPKALPFIRAAINEF